MGDVVGQQEAVGVFKKIIRGDGPFPGAILLEGPGGSGKTSIAKAFLHDYEKARASEKDSRIPGILVLELYEPLDGGNRAVKTKIKNFVQNVPPSSNTLKVVLIDWVDSMTKNAQILLAGVIWGMEEAKKWPLPASHTPNTLFLLIAGGGEGS